MTTLDVVAAACRLLHDAATMLVFGTTSFVSALIPTALGVVIAQRLRTCISFAIVVSVVSAVLWLPLQAVEIVGNWAGAFDIGMLRGVLFDTNIGHVWQGRAALCLLLLVVLALSPLHRARIIAPLSGLLLASLALVGHAATRGGLVGAWQRLNDALHLLSGGAWVGALIPLLFCLSAINDQAHRHDALSALRRFSVAGHVAVTVVILTGVVNIVMVLGRLPTEPSSPYQMLLALKILAVGVMISLATVNRYVLLPRFERHEDASVRSIQFFAGAEIGFGAFVITLVSVFGMLDPV